jgi:hypothetical protein
MASPLRDDLAAAGPKEMKMKTAITTFVLTAGLVLALPALGHTRDDRDAPLKPQLEQRADRLDREIHSATNRGALGRTQRLQERRKVNDLIRRLEAGQTVTPDEVDHLLDAR